MSTSPKPSPDQQGGPDDESVKKFIEGIRLRVAQEKALERMAMAELSSPAVAKSGEPPNQPPPTDDRAKLIHNEGVKLTATLLNGVALAFLVGGGVTVLIGVGNLPNPSDQLIRALVWIIAGGVTHVIARLSLGSLL